MITEAMRIAMSEGQKGCSKPRLRKGVVQFASTGEFLKEYSGMTEASKETGVSRAAILRMLKGEIKRGSKSNPYLWKWSSDYEEIPSKIDPKEVYSDISYKSSISFNLLYTSIIIFLQVVECKNAGPRTDAFLASSE